MHTYFKQELEDGSFQCYQDRGAGFIRKIDADHTAYNEWLKDNTPEKKAYIAPKPEPAYVPTYKELRRNEYPNVGDQLDAILKYIDGLKVSDTEDNADIISIIADWNGIKEKYPKA